MSHRDDVLRQAMALATEDRAYVVAVLERSLSSDLESGVADAEDLDEGISGEALLAELDRRAEAYRTGMTTARPAADVLADLKSRQASEKTA
jgi:hypothetical protein